MKHLLRKFNKILDYCFNYFEDTSLTFDNKRVVIHDNEYLLCRAVVPDVAEMLHLQKMVYTDDNSWDAEVFESELRNEKSKLYLIMRQNDQLVAFIGASFNQKSRDVHISNVAVHPDFQSRGLGQFLIETMINCATFNEYVSLSLETRLSNVRAQKLYSTIGFKNIGLKKSYYQSNHEDAVDMRLSIKNEKETVNE
ncbi:MAG: ribosomal protein S18-alanine N-acetyltransferase [Liquorilactobacillus hordei]|uniref:ribosomal protein S18-alanine N-acetyltransferase n=1 Tax=Liquorilactobacillus hordei TaxID=468911 RepID=UPI001CC0862C|nr:ribosomal protein S18-alanine N-acetyltransferase [Liquorilactobacillus hordei]MBZ2405505.1 ribosomal-protein-alanine N-acetyltransferase [Liquorilactobacillus hordei]